MSKAYINTTCKVGQFEPCGEDAVRVFAVTRIADTSWAVDSRPGGVVALCEFHAKTPVAEWDPTTTQGGHQYRDRPSHRVRQL